ncbi:MAG TPA: hypothetical protein VK832_14945 [Burkholderiaceae bacterium]|jgi:hypothetical protein|nr:hypothetical protein [Burkholderiaceae bacterium]
MSQQFKWHLLDSHEAEQAYQVHLDAIAGQAIGLVRSDDLPHFIAHTGAAGAIIGCFAADGKMVAYGVLGTNSATASHMAKLLHVKTADLERFAILDGAASLSEWRGYGLHRELIQLRLDLAITMGRSLIGATVSPDNILSLRGLLAAQFQIRDFATLYGGLPRLVMQRDMTTVESSWALVRLVDVSDQAAHQAALAQGLIGYACSQTDNQDWQLHYGHAVEI